MKVFLSTLLILTVLSSGIWAQRAATQATPAAPVSPAATTVEVPTVQTPAVDTNTVLGSVGPGLDTLTANFKSVYTVVAGDFLRTIAAREYGSYRYWPALYLANRSTITNPEVIDPASTVKIYSLPFTGSDLGTLEKQLLVLAYMETYKDYLKLGNAWTAQRRWVINEARFFDQNLASSQASTLDPSDLEWLKAK